MFKEINLRNHSSLHKLFYSLNTHIFLIINKPIFIIFIRMIHTLFKPKIFLYLGIRKLKTLPFLRQLPIFFCIS
ncbi:hypothetical protein F8251_10785 [Lactobacillus crispatus]|uniref:Uncharacterized protein n=1 Tax=Lactobacillus crispatus TaxID=47770 RepID=A0A6A1Z3Q4_9LACO|nr:hypothetical protein F8251_10785 [Lactobacillus crispatus]